VAEAAGHGLVPRVVDALASARALPETYLEGFRYQAAHAMEGHRAYLLGELSDTGWRTYYLVAFAVKNTPGLLLAVALGLAMAVRTRGWRGLGWHWLVPAVVVFTVVSLGRIDIGERYLLPVYPYAILLAAAAVPQVLKWRRGHWVLAVVLALHALPSLLVAPRGYLTYFNLLAGGPARGHRVLVDSNLDWGQDLKGLKAWMDGNGVSRVKLSYFGTADPEYHRIACDLLPGQMLPPPRDVVRGIAPGDVVAVSATNLQGVYLEPGDRPLMERLRALTPVATIGHSIRIYRADFAWPAP
jgi:hypothetical protein